MTIVCPKCSGQGEVRDWVACNPLFVIATLGFSLTFRDECTTCNGKGIVQVKSWPAKP